MAVVLYLGPASVDVGPELNDETELLAVSETTDPENDPNRPADSAAIELVGAFIDEVERFAGELRYYSVAGILVAEHQYWSLRLSDIPLPGPLQHWPQSSMGADGKASWALLLRGLVPTEVSYHVNVSSQWPMPT